MHNQITSNFKYPLTEEKERVRCTLTDGLKRHDSGSKRYGHCVKKWRKIERKKKGLDAHSFLFKKYGHFFSYL
jgi:hypothetical protein